MSRKLNLPSIYSVYAKSFMGTVLHLGVYDNLDDAYAAAKDKLESTYPHKQGMSVDLDMWNILPLEDLIPYVIPMMGTKPKPMKQDLKLAYKDAKNELMRTIVMTKDAELFKEMYSAFTSTERKYLKAKIEAA